MNAKELAEMLQHNGEQLELKNMLVGSDYVLAIARHAKKLIPTYRSPQPSDDGCYCYLEELPSDAPPTLVKCVEFTGEDEQGRFRRTEWMFWTVAGWRELKKGIWPCERPQGGAT